MGMGGMSCSAGWGPSRAPLWPAGYLAVGRPAKKPAPAGQLRVSTLSPAARVDYLRLQGYTKRAAEARVNRAREGGQGRRRRNLDKEPHMNKLLRNSLGLAAAGLIACMSMFGTAQATILFPNNIDYVPNVRLDGINALTSAYANATTTATDLVGTEVTLPATRADFTKQYIRVCWSADATKSTSTTGAVGVYVNGALQAASQRYIASAAGRGAIGGCFTVQRSSAVSQVVKLQGVSGDTASFAVTTAQISVERVFIGG